MGTVERIEEARQRLEKAKAAARLDVEPLKFTPPFTAEIGYHDGVFVAIEDAAGERLANLRDIEGAAELVRALNLAAGFDA